MKMFNFIKRLALSVALSLSIFAASFAITPANALSLGDSKDSLMQELSEVQKVVTDSDILILDKELAGYFFQVLGTTPPVEYDEVVVISSEKKGIATLIVLNAGKITNGATLPYDIYKAIIKQALAVQEDNAS